MGRGTALPPAGDLSWRELPGLENEEPMGPFQIWNTAAVSHFGYVDSASCLLAHSIAIRGAVAAPRLCHGWWPLTLWPAESGTWWAAGRVRPWPWWLCVQPRDRFGLWSGWLTRCTIPALLNDLMDEMIVFFWMLIFNSSWDIKCLRREGSGAVNLSNPA